MNHEQAYPNCLHDLVAKLADGKISDTELNKLSDILASNSEARQYYYHYLGIHVMLEWEHGALEPLTLRNTGKNDNLQKRTSPIHIKTPKSSFSWLTQRNIKLIALAAFIVIAIPVIMTIFHTSNTNQTERTKNIVRSEHTLGTLVAATADTQFQLNDKPNSSLDIGSPLKSGVIHLTRGILDIQFNRGAVVRIKSPAKLEMLNPKNVILHHGIVTADVPQKAHGFTINSPILNVIDLGTQFGMAVDNNGQTEVQVFQGEVRINDPQNDNTQSGKVIKEGLAIKKDAPNAPIVQINASTDKYVDLLDKSRDHLIWQNFSANLRQDPNMIFYYTFENLHKTSNTIQNVAKHGLVKSAHWHNGNTIPGRFPQKPAIHFNGNNETLKMNVPGTYDQFTLSAWIKLDNLKTAGSILMSDGHGNPGRDLRWHYKQNGDLKLTITQKNNAGEIQDFRYFALGAIKEAFNDRWLLLTLTYDLQNHQVTHYLNGKKVATRTIPQHAKPISIGNSRIGSWDSLGFRPEKRYYKGAIGEIFMLNRVMTDFEILKMFRQTNPFASKY